MNVRIAPAGNSRTVVICTINPLVQNYQETLNTLKFAFNAGAIKNQVQINEKVLPAKNILSNDQLLEYDELKASVAKNNEKFDKSLLSHANQLNELETHKHLLQIENTVLFDQCLLQQREALIHLNTCSGKEEHIQKMTKENMM